MLHHPDSDLSSGAEIERGHDVLDVVRYCLLGDEKLGGDLSIRQPARDSSGHFLLARCQ